MTPGGRSWRLIGAVVIAIPIVAGIIGVYAASFGSDPSEIRYPASIVARAMTVFLLCIPALIAGIAVIRRSPAMVVTAGGISLLQSLLAFSGATFGFLLPALLLLYLGVRVGGEQGRRAPRRRALLRGVFVVGLTVSAWLVVLGTGQTVCWTAQMGPDGRVEFRQVPETTTLTLGPSDIASGCDSGIPTTSGLIGAGRLILAVSAVAWRTPGSQSA